MAALIFAFMVVVILQGVAADETCTYQSGGFTLNAYCDWGCCYSYIYPCCDPPVYTKSYFIAPLVSVSILLVALVVSAFFYRWRRNQPVTIQYGRPVPPPQVISTNTTANISYPPAYNQVGYNQSVNSQSNFGPAPPYTADLPKY